MRATFKLFAILALAIGLAAPAMVHAAESCERAFVTDLYHSSPDVLRSTDWGPAFDKASFEKAWRGLEKMAAGNREVVVRPYSDQTDRNAQLLRVDMHLSGDPGVRPLRILITSGVHGNESMGVQTAIDLMHALAATHGSQPLEIVFLPALNFDGLLRVRRKSVDDTDLNRQFADAIPSAAIARIKHEIGSQHFDLSLDLHGAYRRMGFFVIKSGDDHGVAESALNEIDDSLRLRADDGGPTGAVGLKTDHGIEHRYDLEAPGLASSVNVGTMKSYMASIGTPFAYTIEYPGEIPPALARQTNLKLVMGIIEEIKKTIAGRD